MVKKIIQIIKELYFKSSSERYITYLRKKGIKIGNGTIILYPWRIEIDATRPELIEIGSNVLLHKGTTLMAHDFASRAFVTKYNEFIPSHSKIKIGNNVWLGENVTILKGVTIGDNVIIGYGAVVTKSIPSNSVAVGFPAKVISSFDDYYKKRLDSYHWEAIEYAKEIIASGREPMVEDFYDDYPCFVDGENYQEYNYPYSRIFTKDQFEQWKKTHKKIFNGFNDFIAFVKNSQEK